MTDILALIAAIFLLLQLQQLRAMLSFVFVPRPARALGAVRVPEALADLHEEAAQELRALGYTGPHWFQLDAPADSGMPVLLWAAWRNVDSGDTVWLSPPQSAVQPNRLSSWFVRRLDDGRHCVSQPFDPYAEISADGQVLGQTIGGADFAAQQQLHAAWCERQGRVDLAGTDDAALHWQASELHAARIDSLLRRGKLYRDRRGLLRPKLAFALKILGALRRAPKIASRGPVPPARLAWLAEVQQRLTLRPVPRRVQAGLFALSVALFLAAGAWLWDARVALILFVVIAIHELGHYLAMRAFGYRNVQMLALPLVGGVTIGHEARPDAARRAWMSLMGPLPGIVIGWLLLWLSLDGQGLGGVLGFLVSREGLLAQAALVFLFLNYLNVLPLPPLDGAHVVQELLPAGAPRLSAVFLVVACVVGGGLAIWAGFYLLAVLAALQLPLARSRWSLGEVLTRLRKDPQLAKQKLPALRRQRIFEVFDAVQGPTALAAPRLALGAEAERNLAVRPMRPLQRLAVGLVYSVLLAGPVVVAVIGVAMLQDRAGASADTAHYQAQAAEWKQRASQQELAVLLTDLRDHRQALQEQPDVRQMAPADAAALAAAGTRLGRELPAEVRQVYTLPGAMAALDLLPPDQLDRASAAGDLDLDGWAYEGRIGFHAPELPDVEINLTPTQLRGLLLLSHASGYGQALLYDDATPPLHADLRVYLLDSEGSSVAFGNLRQYVELQWMDYGQSRQYRQSYDKSLARERARLANASLEELLAAAERPSWLQRQLTPQLAWPGPADPAHIAAASQRLGHEIPPDLQALYARHDGFPPLRLLPLQRWQPTAQLDAQTQQLLRTRQSGVDGFPDLTACIMIGGIVVEAVLYQPTVFWCPDNPADSRLTGTGEPYRAARVEDLLRETIARQRAKSNGMAL
ncbi:site-2 protease family protein [Tahibacter harae]|uniref:Knr4/Smi1-like domain-containing protein n=1 Tax=Tahibacter harae TaxID=2963937 RepID=A0ABT1QYK8_9GAMM|nr:site-2 protease family protein [Tahibacter harae]MCQ4167377.1 hypothetical protein [Tahibacter harae]